MRPSIPISGVARATVFRRQFLRLFAADFRRLGLKASVRSMGGKVLFRADILPTGQATMLRLARRLRGLQFDERREFLKAVHARYANSLLRSEAVDVSRVQPVLELCSNRETFDLFTYCRLLQGIPNAPLVGRRMSWLVFDGVGNDRRLIGAFGLNSSPYSLGSRDSYLGWAGAAGDARKRVGLLCVLDMPLCTALPPYTRVLGGKLIASLALTSEVNAAFVQRYATRIPPGGSLLAVITLCATGLHCPVFNRIMLKPGGLYRRVGATAGYSTAFVSDPTITLAHSVVREARKGLRKPLFAKSMRIVKSALETCGLPGERLLRLGVRKGVYVGAVDSSAIDALRTQEFSDLRRPTVEDVRVYWSALAARRLPMAGLP